MKWTVLSHRMAWDAGTVLTEADLVGCNIDALVQGGHLAPADMKTNKQPVHPAPNDPADEPEEKQ